MEAPLCSLECLASPRSEYRDCDVRCSSSGDAVERKQARVDERFARFLFERRLLSAGATPDGHPRAIQDWTRNLLRSARSPCHTLERDLESGVHSESPARDLHASTHLLAEFGGALLGFSLGGFFIEQPLRISRFVFARRDGDVFHRYVWSEHPGFCRCPGGRERFRRS